MSRAGPADLHPEYRIALNQIATTFRAFDACWTQLSDTSTRNYQLGPNRLCLTFAGELLKSVLADAFEHLAINDEQVPALTIRVWDSKEQQIPVPLLDWQRLHANGYRGYAQGPYYFHYFDSIGALSFLNTEENLAYYVVRDAQALPWWVRGSPLQVILGAWLRCRGTQLTHVGAVGDEAKCVLLAGKGGSGKTTTTLSCVLEGLNYLGEDYCLLTPGNCPTVHSIYQTAKWTPQTRRFYPEYERFVANPASDPSEKSLFFYQDLFPARIRVSLPARAIVSLSVGDTETPRMREIDLATTLKNLSFSTVRQLPFFDSSTLALIRQFAQSLPHYAMELGRDRLANVNAIRSILLDTPH